MSAGCWLLPRHCQMGTGHWAVVLKRRGWLRRWPPISGLATSTTPTLPPAKPHRFEQPYPLRQRVDAAVIVTLQGLDIHLAALQTGHSVAPGCACQQPVMLSSGSSQPTTKRQQCCACAVEACDGPVRNWGQHMQRAQAYACDAAIDAAY